MIVVQAKDLFLYQIDFIKHEVVRKIMDEPHSIQMKSIFYGISSDKRERQLRLAVQIKTFIQEQEEAGNKVLLPKINDKIIAVQIGTSNLIKIYSIKLKQFVRQFILSDKEVVYDCHQGFIDTAEPIEGHIDFLLENADARMQEKLGNVVEKVKKLKRVKVPKCAFMQTFRHNKKKDKQMQLNDIEHYMKGDYFDPKPSKINTTTQSADSGNSAVNQSLKKKRLKACDRDNSKGAA